MASSGERLYHVMLDAGLLDTVQFSQPGSIEEGWWKSMFTSGESEIKRRFCINKKNNNNN